MTKHAIAARNLCAALKASDDVICSGYEVFCTSALVWACFRGEDGRETYTYSVHADGTYDID